jgi:hypothetical protein
MKNYIFVFFLISIVSKAQDTLILKNETKIISLVLLVNDELIRYKKIDNITGPDILIPSAEVRAIHYKNGKKEIIENFSSPAIQVVTAPKLTEAPVVDWEGPEKMYEQGQKHAEIFYKHGGGSRAIGIGSLFLTPFTFIPVGILMFKTPAEKFLGYQSEELWKNEHYQKGYKAMATSIRRKKMVKSFIAGSIVSHFIVGFIAVKQVSNTQ